MSVNQIRTTVTFVAVLGVLVGSYQLERRMSGRYVDVPYTWLVTSVATYLGNLVLPFQVTQPADVTLSANGVAVVVRAGCNGIEVLFLMVAGIIAFPARWQVKARALVKYLPALFFLNVVRVLMLLAVMATFPDLMNVFHYQVGQGIMVLFVLVFWVQHLRTSGIAAPAVAE